MIIGERIQTIRKQKDLSQRDIENRTGLLRCYISRIENGHTVPSIETLEKMARALEVPLYQLFYEGEEPPKLPPLPSAEKEMNELPSNGGKWGRIVRRLRGHLERMNRDDRELLLGVALKMARRSKA